jgi:hypothetical protein
MKQCIHFSDDRNEDAMLVKACASIETLSDKNPNLTLTTLKQHTFIEALESRGKLGPTLCWVLTFSVDLR